MKILHVNDQYTPRGGVEQYILSVMGLLQEHGHSQLVLYTQQQSADIRHGPCPAYPLPADDPALEDKIRSIVELEQPDVAYLHHVSSSAVVRLVCHLLPAVAYVHGFAPVCPGLAKYFRRGEVVCNQTMTIFRYRPAEQ